MSGIMWQVGGAVEHAPAGPGEAVQLLDAGNAAFTALDPSAVDPLVLPITADDLGFGAVPGVAPTQTPFAAVLGCADARVPIEQVFLQSANDLFVVRVAGNVPGAECVGSIDYAIGHLPSVRLLAVVGHTSCGAVSAALDAYLDPAGYLGVSANLPLRRIVDSIMPSVRAADAALASVHGPEVTTAAGYRAALLDTAVVLNAAGVADAITRIFAANLGENLGVVVGVYDLASRAVGLPSAAADGPTWQAGLVDVPKADQMADFATGIVLTRYVADLLDGPAPASH